MPDDAALSSFRRTREQRYFEDYEPGAVYRFGSVLVEEAELVDFARRYDPQPIHIDPAFAAVGPFGGLIASGWYTCALMMRLLAQYYLPSTSSLGSPGVDDLRWLEPVRPGDELSVRVEVLWARRSASRPGRGIVRSRIEVLNQRDAVVMALEATNFLLAEREG